MAEGFVRTPHAECLAENVCARSSAYCRSIGAHSTDKLLDFGAARAILRATDEALHFRVEAEDFVIFSSIRTLLQGSLATITTVPDAAVEWQPAGSVPFRAIRERLENRQNWPGGR
ncbi:SMa0974 family conjugal transfer regulator [Sinorhizobium fredii]|uniref:SMa0974 family conjugal transfer regulator n=1 Tax=Sinorhizobium TaxID=28105 RepID=UPI003B522842